MNENARHCFTDSYQDDIMIDIFVTEHTDTVGMSIEFAEDVMTEEDARDIIERWSTFASTYTSHSTDGYLEHIWAKVSRNKHCIIF